MAAPIRQFAKARRICFVTGTRAEFGLMKTVLDCIKKTKDLQLQIIVTGMHLSSGHGRTIDEIRAEGWHIDGIVPWKGKLLSQATGLATAGLAAELLALKSDIVLVVGDRVEALATAVAGHLLGIVVAHVHGGDRALGQVDDSLRHAITKMAHVHFPATKESAHRIRRMGEDEWRIHWAGSPGIDGIRQSAASWKKIHSEFPTLRKNRYALLVLHPADADESIEFKRARTVLASLLSAGFEQIVIVYPNNDPGHRGIIQAWEQLHDPARVFIRKNLPRDLFLGLMRDAAVVAGNSSSGIIEAASFATPVIDIGPRQLGRECASDVVHVSYSPKAITTAAAKIWNGGKPLRSKGRNPYESKDAGRKIAHALSALQINAGLLRKIIRY